MERGSKRKAALAIAASPDGRASKRQKTPDSHRQSSTGETPESTMEAGLKFVEALKAATDNHGRKYTGAFLTLPDRDDFPDYYEHIKMPLAIDTVEAKLRRKGYPTLAALEGDMKRLVSNAKTYNEKSSDIFADAERIRKMLGNYMKKVNPAYSDPTYTAVPTPIPEDLQNGTTTQEPLQNGVKLVMKETQQEEQEEDDPNTPNFRGKSFQDAQDMIINELISYKEGDLRIYEPFLNLPPRSLVDYYAVIKYPTCLKGVQKKVRGVHGRSEVTGSTDLMSWDSFENEMSRIWQNAREYNEDGSDMFNLAAELEEHFQELLEAAKKVVDEPAHLTLKLKMGAAPPSIKLRLGSQKMSPAPNSASPAPVSSNLGVSVDQEALERQRRHVQAGSNGVSQSRPSSSQSGSQVAPTTASAGPHERHQSGSAVSPPLSATNIKTEGQMSQPPVTMNGIVNSQPHSNHIAPTVMLPPQRPASGSPHPYAPQASYLQHNHVPHAQPDLSKWRAKGADASTALFNPLTISTPPTLPLPAPFSYSLAADERLTHQSVTLNLPPTHHTLLFTPTIRNEVFATGLYRLFVTANGMRVMGGPMGGPGGDPRKPVHEVRLIPGVNRIEVEMVAEPVKKEDEADGGGEDRDRPAGGVAATKALDVEKASVFVQLMRA